MKSKSTTKLLTELRHLMKNKAYVPHPLNAYIIPSGDAHQSEYIAPCDKRREFISGFTGSMGTAIVTQTKAALWTDGRYFLQAEKELDDNWILMKQGLPTTLTESKWLNDELSEGSLVGVDPYLFDAQRWKELSKELILYGHSLVPISQNLVDIVWHERPPAPTSIVFPLELKFTGQSLDEKIEIIRQKLQEEGATAIILTALDELAYTFNLRGSDIEYNPVFFSYAIITMKEVFLYINESKLTSSALSHLQAGKIKVKIMPYEDILKDVEKMLLTESGRVWVPNRCSYAISAKVPSLRRISKLSPVAVMKSIKNDTERKGLRACHVRDGAALCRYLCWLEKEAPRGEHTEITAADVLEQFRSEQDNYVGLSFTSVSAVGPNAAIVHYQPSPETDRKITTEEIYLIDSGGQYKDGTTDVTRTVHFGSPSEFEKECFTRVLKGQIAVANCIFPTKIKGNCLDTLARKFLWDVGLDYGHGTGHGIGMYLNVHEGPMGVSWRPIQDDCGLSEGMFLSDEPGYYEDGKFGIRLENIVEIVKADTPHNHKERGYLTFNTVTLAPIQTKLICPDMLTAKEVEWLNDYHSRVLESVGPVLLEQGHKETYTWLAKETRPIG